MANRIQGITVEIGGDTTKLSSALKSLNGEIKNTQNQLKDVEKLLKMDPGNTELLAQKEKLLAQAVDETKQKLETLKTAANQANDALAKGEISQEQYDALQREIAETEQSLKSLETQANESAAAMQKIANSGEKLKTAGEGISNAGKKLMPVTAAATGLGAASLTTAANFESSMSQVQATMGITKDAMTTVNGQTVNTMDALNALAKEMGASTAFSASECADALNYLALAGYSAQEMTDTLPIVLNLAAAGGIDLASASDMVTDAMSALGMETSDAGLMVDQMAKTASSTNTSVSQLGQAILTIGATAKSIKGGTAELNTALGILANNGIKGAEGGTKLRNIILSLQNPTDGAANKLNELGVSVYDSEGNMRSLNDILGDLNTSMDGMTEADKANIISTIFNKADLAAANSLLANTGSTWDSLQKSIIDSGGAAGQMADTQLDNLQGQITLLKSALEGLAISFGQLLMPAIKGIVDGVQKLVDWLNSLDEGTKKTIVTIALIVGALGPVLIIVGKVISAVGTIMTIVPKIAGIIKTVQGAFAALNTTMLANPIFLIIAAIAALVAAFIYLWNNCEGFRQFWIDLWENVKGIVSAAIEGIKAFFTGIIDFVKNNWQALLLFIVNPFAGAFKLLYDNCEGFRNFINNLLEAIKTGLANAWEAIKSGVETAWNAIGEFFTSILTAIKTTFTTIWESIKTAVTTVMNTIKTTISNLWNGIKTTITNIVNGIKTTVSNVFNNILSGIKTTVGNIASAIKKGFKAAIDFITSLPSKALQWGKDMIMGLVNGIKSCINDVKEAVKSVAEKITSFLHFSVPDEGPLSDYEKWMPDFMKGLASGIEKSKTLVAKAVDGVASDMVLNPNVNLATIDNISSSNGSTQTDLVSAIREAMSGGGTESSETVVPIYIGNKLIDELILDSKSRISVRSGGLANV